MRAIAIINFCVALLLTIVSGDFQRDQIIEVLNKMAETGELINDIFKPSKDGLLASGYYGIVYEGQLLLKEKIQVAMKFVHVKKSYGREREYRAYTYLDAFNSDVEAYGIPTIYYYGKWHNHTMLAMKLLDSTYQTRIKADGFSEWDLLVLLREFVKIIKYVHSKGIIHCNVNFDDMIIHEGQGFIFGFTSSMDMAQSSHEHNIWDAKNDFKELLSSLFNSPHLLPGWPWFKLTYEENYYHGHFAKLQEFAKTDRWSHVTGAKKVFLEFTKHASDKIKTVVQDANGNEIPFYDHLYQIIIEEMKDEVSSSIPSIPDPFGPEHDFRVSRPEVNTHLFEEMYTPQKVFNHQDWIREREEIERATYAEQKKKNEKAFGSCGLTNLWGWRKKD